MPEECSISAFRPLGVEKAAAIFEGLGGFVQRLEKTLQYSWLPVTDCERRQGTASRDHCSDGRSFCKAAMWEEDDCSPSCTCACAHGTCGARLWALPCSNPRAAGISQGDACCNLIIQMALMSLVRVEGGGQALTLGTWGRAWRSLLALPLVLRWASRLHLVHYACSRGPQVPKMLTTTQLW